SAALCNQQVGVAIEIEIRSNEGTRRLQLKLVQPCGHRNIAEAARAFVAQQTKLTAAAGVLSNRGDINPTIVVVIERHHAKTAPPAELWQRNALEALAFNVAPKRQPGCAGMREHKVHPAVFVEIERCETNRVCGDIAGPNRRGLPLPFSRIPE